MAVSRSRFLESRAGEIPLLLIVSHFRLVPRVSNVPLRNEVKYLRNRVRAGGKYWGLSKGYIYTAVNAPRD